MFDASEGQGTRPGVRPGSIGAWVEMMSFFVAIATMLWGGIVAIANFFVQLVTLLVQWGMEAIGAFVAAIISTIETLVKAIVLTFFYLIFATQLVIVLVLFIAFFIGYKLYAEFNENSIVRDGLSQGEIWIELETVRGISKFECVIRLITVPWLDLDVPDLKIIFIYENSIIFESWMGIGALVEPEFLPDASVGQQFVIEETSSGYLNQMSKSILDSTNIYDDSAFLDGLTTTFFFMSAFIGVLYLCKYAWKAGPQASGWATAFTIVAIGLLITSFIVNTFFGFSESDISKKFSYFLGCWVVYMICFFTISVFFKSFNFPLSLNLLQFEIGEASLAFYELILKTIGKFVAFLIPMLGIGFRFLPDIPIELSTTATLVAGITTFIVGTALIRFELINVSEIDTGWKIMNLCALLCLVFGITTITFGAISLFT